MAEPLLCKAGLKKYEQGNGYANHLATAQIRFLHAELVQNGGRFKGKGNGPAAGKQ